MTTPPRVSKFRIRRSAAPAVPPGAPAAAAPAAAAAATTAPADPAPAGNLRAMAGSTGPAAGGGRAAAPQGTRPARLAAMAGRAPIRAAGPDAETEDDGFGAAPYPTAAAADAVLGPNEMSPEEEIAAIRAEGLTGRQLRMARRVAQKYGIDATSDFEAVRILRRRGIDPFQRSNMIDLVVAGARQDGARQDGARQDGARIQLPQTVRGDATLPSTEFIGADTRAGEILRIQQDIARRRQRKLVLLFTRLAFFVLLPTLIAGWYYFRVATPLYATKSEFVIQQAESKFGGGFGSLFSGTQFATSQDSITVQGYLQSREAMLRLDQDQGFRAHWSKPNIDPVQRLDPDATAEAVYRLYKRNVRIGYDPTEGVIKMEVIAADPQVSAAFSRALIGYAEEQVDHLTQRMREDQMKGARESYQDAENKVFAAQARVLDLQQKLGVLDPVSENSVVMTQVSTFEVQLAEKRLELRQLMDNPKPNAARVAGVEGDIERLQRLIAELRATLTADGAGNTSLAAVTGELRIAEAELETRQMLLSAAAQQMETARIEANKQVRYLSTGVRPLPPDEATYPRAFENTLVALLIFGGIYLMLSLTASILREQVSA